MSNFKGVVTLQLLVNAFYGFFWTTARKCMDLINESQHTSVRETDQISSHSSIVVLYSIGP